MKASLISILLTLVVPFAAKAQQQSQTRDLTDLMSPDEIAQELPQEEPSLQDMFWQSSLEQPRLVIVVNKAEKGTAIDAQTLEAWVDGELLFRGVVSTAKEKTVHAGPSKNYPQGRDYRAHTPTGTYRITHRDINHVSNTWQGASMPFAQFFVGGIAIHATVPEHFAMLGQRDSGGCVRMWPKDAKLMWNLVDQIGPKETEIIVYDGSVSPHPLGKPAEAPKHGLPSTGVKPIVANVTTA